MADKSIGELKKATYFDDNSLIPAEQGGEAQALSGALLREFAEDAGRAAGKAAVTDEVEQAAAYANEAAQARQNAQASENNAASSENAAAGSATKAAQSEKNAADSAATAQQYSGNPPKPINGTWWIWDAGIGSYKDTGVSSILRIVKSYTSIEAMEADYGNMQDNDLVIIATDVELEENSKLYIHTPTGWQYLSDLSGVQGPPGRSAYEVAQEGGYTGSEAEFWQDLTQFKPLSEQAVAAATAAGESERKAQTSETNAKNSENAAKASSATAADSEAAAKTAEDNAKAAQAAAEKARDDAQAIAGGDFMTPAVYDPQGKAQDIFAYADAKAGSRTFSATHPESADGEEGDLWFVYAGRDDNTLLLLPSDDLTDRSPYSTPLTNHGVVVSNTVSKFGTGSMYFDGTSYLSFESTNFNFGTGDFTIEFWARPEVLEASDRFLFSGSEKGDLFLGISGGTHLGIGRVGVAWDHKARVSLVSGEWNHVAVVKANGTMYFFLNGAVIYSLANSASYGFPSGKINVCAQGGLYCFNGYIDELRVSNVARWTAAFTPPSVSYAETKSNNEAFFKKDGKWHEMVTLPDVAGQITTHNADTEAHPNIRKSLSDTYSVANNARALAGDAYNLGNAAKTAAAAAQTTADNAASTAAAAQTAINALKTKTLIFTLEDGSIVTEEVYVK